VTIAAPRSDETFEAQLESDEFQMRLINGN
jgi:hypothetical protein